MKKFLSFLMIFIFAVSISNAQFTVFFVNDDDNAGSGLINIPLALDDWGGVYTTWDCETEGAAPTYADMSTYDMVIWYTGRDGQNLYLWGNIEEDTASVGYTAMEYNDDLIQFADNGGIVWVDMPDGFYDICGSAPNAFSSGDFVYDKLGIAEYSVQSWEDDGETGVVQADKSTENTVSTLGTVMWAWSELHLADGFTLTAAATPLYEMGPAGYVFDGYPMMLFKDGYITSSMRTARLGDGTETVQTTINTFYRDIIEAAQTGFFTTKVNDIENNINISVYPNPAIDFVTITFPVSNQQANIIIYDNTGKQIINNTINANSGSHKLDISNFNSGIYLYQITIDNKTFISKLSVVK